MNKNKKITLIISIALVSIILLIGVTYALTYTESSTNQELVLGDIYMHYNEISGLSITDAVPGSDYSNYFEFTISGKNTYTKKDIYYDFVLNRGYIPTGASEENRIPDKYLKFKLVSVDDSNQETEIFADKTYASLNNQRIHVETIEKNTTNEVNRKYRLYMTIDNSLLIGNTSDAVFTFDEFENAFGSVKLNVTGDFSKKEVELTASKTMLKAIETNTDASCNPIIEEDGIIYFYGTNDCVDFNYVWYSGKLWRIIAINPDETMKLVTEDAITTINWGATATVSETDLTSAYPTSWIRQWLNQEFLPTLYNYENIIDVNAGWYSVTCDLLAGNNGICPKPTGEYTVTDPVGLISQYEYGMNQIYEAGKKSYIENGYYWWVINPQINGNNIYVIASSGRGNGGMAAVPSRGSYGVRPSIVLKSNVIFSNGLGTINEPYKIEGDLDEATLNTTLLNTRVSGEYVKLEGDTENQVFRIVDIEKIGEKLTTKVVLNDYVKESSNVLTKALSDSYKYLWNEQSKEDSTYWRGYLNTTWLQNFNTNMLEKGIYYLGEYYKYYDVNTSYKTTVCSMDNSQISIRQCIENGTIVEDVVTDDYVGLLRVGEMFASQIGEDEDFASDMWMLSPPAILHRDGFIWETDPSRSYAARPTINLTNTVVIKSGSGTKQDPFVVGLPS